MDGKFEEIVTSRDLRNRPSSSATVAKTQSGSRKSRGKAPAKPIPKVAEVTRVVSVVTLRLECKELKLDFKGDKKELESRLGRERIRICSIRKLTSSKLISQVTKAGFKDAPSMSRIQLCDILIEKKISTTSVVPPVPTSFHVACFKPIAKSTTIALSLSTTTVSAAAANATTVYAAATTHAPTPAPTTTNATTTNSTANATANAASAIATSSATAASATAASATAAITTANAATANATTANATTTVLPPTTVSTSNPTTSAVG